MRSAPQSRLSAAIVRIRTIVSLETFGFATLCLVFHSAFSAMSCSRERGKSQSKPTTAGPGRVATRTKVFSRSSA